MNNIKPLYQDLLISRFVVQKVLGQIDKLVTSGTSDDRKKSQSLIAELSEVLLEEKRALTNYTDAVNSTILITRVGGSVITHNKYLLLSHQDQQAFIKAGGKIRN